MTTFQYILLIFLDAANIKFALSSDFIANNTIILSFNVIFSAILSIFAL